jgi:hypothetical protein
MMLIQLVQVLLLLLMHLSTMMGGHSSLGHGLHNKVTIHTPYHTIGEIWTNGTYQ